MKRIIVILFAVVSLTGCKKFLDINENPNLPTEGSIPLLLPAVQAAIGHALGNPLQIHGSVWAQYWTQNPTSSQYRSIDQYNVTTSDFDRPWRMIYSDAMQDIEEMLTLSEGREEFQQHRAIAYIMKAYAFQLATDAFGDIPLTEANDPDNTNPVYDPQQRVYDSIFVLIDIGIGLIDVDAVARPTNDDLIFQGDMEQWLRFANTLKLRAYLRLSEVDPGKAAAGIAALNDAQFLEDDAQIEYTSIGGNQNPLFSEILGLDRVQNLVASETVAKFMTDNRDPRADVFFDRYVAADMDSIIGIPQGSYRTNTRVVSFPSAAVGADARNDQSANAPVKFISAAESYFLQAEAVVRGWLDADMTAMELYREGIRASFASYDVPGVDQYISTSPAAAWPAGTEAQIRAIIIQKWLAMTGNQGFEAWTEWRRTGYPEFLTVSEATALGDDRMPARILYPSSELTRNVEFPGVKQVWEPVWWDVE